jgi:UDP-N-acetylmuramate dehydrogenase
MLLPDVLTRTATLCWPADFSMALAAEFGARPRYNELLSGHTTSRLGGPADIWLSVTTLTDLIQVIQLARQYQIPVFMLGSGANLLIQDGGIRGLVIENRTRRIRLNPVVDVTGLHHITVESGVILPTLARRCAKLGLSGFEWAIGVPGTVGGAVANNAGAYNGDMAANLVRAELLSPSGERVWQTVEWFEYGYRWSRLKRSPIDFGKSGQKDTAWIILQAELQLKPASPDEIQARLEKFNERRKNSQPPGATMGSMFKNPPGDYAGRLIEAAGLKGYRLGQAQISPIHANFFQNLGGATAADMLGLIKVAQEIVTAKFGVQLELEIEVVGEPG